MIFSFTACSNDDEEIPQPTIPEENEYIKYVDLKRSTYGFIKDVKEAERIFFDRAEWNYETESVDKKYMTNKKKFYFDENGALTQSEEFNTYKSVVGDKIELILYRTKEEIYSYDDKYRITKEISRGFSGLEETLNNERVISYTYDETNKRVTIVTEYKFDPDASLKQIWPLDENGRIDDTYVEFYEKTDSSAATAKRLRDSLETRLIRGYDAKGNSTSSYISNTYGYDDHTKEIYIGSYWEHNFIYYDGTKSDINNSTYEDTRAEYKSYYAMGHSLNGNVKSIMNYYFYEGKYLPYPIPSPMDERYIQNKIESQYDKEGIKIQTANYNRSIYVEENDYEAKFGPLRLSNLEKHEYDSKYRITATYKDSYEYSSPLETTPYSISKTKLIIIYDDINKKATLETYSITENSEELTYKYTCALTSDGFVNTAYQDHNKSKSTKSSNIEFNKTPSHSMQYIEKTDNQKNWIERYCIVKIYDNKGEQTDIYTSDYQKQEIEYY
jgi:hypothetical protein